MVKVRIKSDDRQVVPNPRYAVGFLGLSCLAILFLGRPGRPDLWNDLVAISSTHDDELITLSVEQETTKQIRSDQEEGMSIPPAIEGKVVERTTITPSPTVTSGIPSIRQNDHHIRDESRQKVAIVDGKEVVIPPEVRCPSLYLVGNRSEHSPLIFRRDNLLVCRTPKVGSTLIRSIADSYEWNETKILSPCWESTNGTNRIQNISNATTFNHLLYSWTLDRIMFVRHPVTRILAGFLEVAERPRWTDHFWKNMYGFRRNHGHGPKAFWKWLTKSNFTKEYEESACTKYQQYALDALRQHWLPAQHCRCGQWDCGVPWTYYKIEEVDMISIMASYLPNARQWLSTDRNKRHSHMNKRSYNPSKYLTPKAVEFLNNLTREEQEYFGYKPYVVVESNETKDSLLLPKKRKKKRTKKTRQTDPIN